MNYNKDLTQMQKYIQSIVKKNKLHTHSPQLSSKTTYLLKTLYEQLCVSQKNWKSKIESKHSFSYDELVNKHPSILDTINSISVEDAKNNIKSKIKHAHQYMLRIHDREINVYMFFPKSFGEEQNRMIYVKKIIMWLDIAFQYSDPKCSNKMSIYLFYSDMMKTLPLSPIPLNSSHVNTAFTTSCQPSTQIIIFRFEEWFKVFIHETIHSLGLDFSEMDANESNKEVLQLFKGCNKQNDVRLYESYCEVWGETMNILFCALLENSKSNSIMTKRKHTFTKTKKSHVFSPTYHKIMPNILYRLKCEQAFSLIQCAKILDLYGITYKDLIYGTHGHKYTEETSTLSYYFIKCIFLCNLNTFMEWCIHNNDPPLRFNKNNIHKYIELLKTLYKDETHMKHLEYAKKYIHFSSLRMTINE